MSSKHKTLNHGPGNDAYRGSGLPTFLVVENNNQKAAILRNPNYQELIASIKKHVHGFKTTPDDQIVVSAFLEEVDDHVQITEEVWANFLPRLLTIQVGLGHELHGSAPASNTRTNKNRQHFVPRSRAWATPNFSVGEVEPDTASFHLNSLRGPYFTANQIGGAWRTLWADTLASESSGVSNPQLDQQSTAEIDSDNLETIPPPFKRGQPSQERSSGFGLI
ncbi:unnamed protein product [Rhizoctonia solani]|uniref:Uncharacterized protein n=1 Tax=Rhizoctonia solani TaxID=456999 RepID=A0A8H2X3F4_9AGAM|nr:unnamed protein product [Rhizoctonia solani]